MSHNTSHDSSEAQVGELRRSASQFNMRRIYDDPRPGGHVAVDALLLVLDAREHRYSHGLVPFFVDLFCINCDTGCVGWIESRLTREIE